jgi:hypothetical protein
MRIVNNLDQDQVPFIPLRGRWASTIEAHDAPARRLPFRARPDTPAVWRGRDDPDFSTPCPAAAWTRFSLFVTFVRLCLRLVCAEQVKPRDSVSELDRMEVEQQP